MNFFLYTADLGMFVGYWDSSEGKWINEIDSTFQPTHWMTLPPAPFIPLLINVYRNY